MSGARQIVGRFGIKRTKPGRVIHTGRVSSVNGLRKPRTQRALRPRIKPRLSR